MRVLFFVRERHPTFRVDVTVPLHVDDYTRWRLMEGLDDIGLTLRDEPAITAYEEKRPAYKPTILG